MKQNGFSFLASLIFLLLLTMLGISMMGGFTRDEKISGNFREKNRAVDAAQTVLNGAESWMSQPDSTYIGGNWVTGQDCSSLGAITISNAQSASQVICSNAISAITNPTTLPWSGFNMITAPSGMNVSTSGGLNTYADNAHYYIQYLGTTSANPPTAVYQVTATAQGGNSNAATVIQATYQVQATSRDLSGG